MGNSGSQQRIYEPAVTPKEGVMRFVSLFTMKPIVLRSLCGVTLLSAACAGGVPTRPSVSTSGSIPLPSNLESVNAHDEQVTRPLPFHGSLQGTDTDTIAFPFLSVHLAATGNATHLGDYTATFDFRVDLRTPASPAVGSFTLTAANGDTLFGDLVGHASIGNGIATVIETATVTGGTGRLAQATGEFTTTRTVVQATGTSSGSFDGWIDLHE
jgi:hypothetical protein